jgi:hypothetical protein
MKEKVNNQVLFDKVNGVTIAGGLQPNQTAQLKFQSDNWVKVTTGSALRHEYQQRGKQAQQRLSPTLSWRLHIMADMFMLACCAGLI